MGETPPKPKSPPEYPDVCGKHRLQMAVQALDKEIQFLQGELHSLEGIRPASKCCKEVTEFVGTNPDPLMKANKKRNNSCCIWKILRNKKRNNSCCIWKILRAILCCNFASICCSSRYLFPLKTPKWWCPISCCHSHINFTREQVTK